MLYEKVIRVNWELTLFFIAAVHGVILSLFFIIDSASTRKVFLGIYLLTFSITILHYVQFWHGVRLPVFWQWLGVISSWLMPPALYLYYRPPIKFRVSQFIHLLIPAVFTIRWLIAINSEFSREHYIIAGNIISFSKISIFILYGILIYRYVKLKKKDVYFLMGYVLFIVGLAAYRVMVLANSYFLEIDYIICAGYVILIYGLTYSLQLGYLKSKVNPKYASSSLTAEDGRHLVERINKALTEEKHYHDPAFNLSKLASHLKVPKYRISQALNAYSNKSFSELVNEYRIVEASNKIKCSTTHHLKLEAIGEAVGFSNKVSFYKNFKKIIGLSPGEFKQQQDSSP